MWQWCWQPHHSSFPHLSPWERQRDILIEAPGKAASGAVTTDVFLLPFGDGGRERLGRERLPRWVALITLLQEEVERKSLSCVPTDLGPQALRTADPDGLISPCGLTAALGSLGSWPGGVDWRTPVRTLASLVKKLPQGVRSSQEDHPGTGRMCGGERGF